MEEIERAKAGSNPNFDTEEKRAADQNKLRPPNDGSDLVVGSTIRPTLQPPMVGDANPLTAEQQQGDLEEAALTGEGQLPIEEMLAESRKQFEVEQTGRQEAFERDQEAREHQLRRHHDAILDRAKNREERRQAQEENDQMAFKA